MTLVYENAKKGCILKFYPYLAVTLNPDLPVNADEKTVFKVFFNLTNLSMFKSTLSSMSSFLSVLAASVVLCISMPSLTSAQNVSDVRGGYYMEQ